jgi:hypothetical protein
MDELIKLIEASPRDDLATLTVIELLDFLEELQSYEESHPSGRPELV